LFSPSRSDAPQCSYGVPETHAHPDWYEGPNTIKAAYPKGQVDAFL